MVKIRIGNEIQDIPEEDLFIFGEEGTDYVRVEEKRETIEDVMNNGKPPIDCTEAADETFDFIEKINSMGDYHGH